MCVSPASVPQLTRGRERAVLRPQAVLFDILRSITLLSAPVVPYTADDVFRHSLPLLGLEQASDDILASLETSVFDAGFLDPPAEWEVEAVRRDWVTIMSMREEVRGAVW